jgi:hypothetical protein
MLFPGWRVDLTESVAKQLLASFKFGELQKQGQQYFFWKRVIIQADKKYGFDYML